MDTPRYKELQQKLAEQTDENRKIDIRIDIATEVRNFDVEEASKMADSIITRSRELAYTNGIGRGLKLKGSCHWLKGEYESGLEVLKEAFGIAVKTKDKKLEARVLYYCGNIYRDQGELAKVLTNYRKALAINEELGDEFAQSVILTSISNLLYDLNDYDSALEYALKCLPIFERAHNVASLINVYNTLGNIYFKKEQFPEALHYFQENLGHSEYETIAYVMAESGLGKVYYKMQNFDNARKLLSNALRQSEHLGNVEVQIICQYYLGRMYMDKASYRQSLQYLNHAFTLASEYNRRHDLMSIHEMLSTLYDKMVDIPKAFFHLKSYQQLKEEIFQQTIFNELRNLQVRQQIELAQKEKEVAEQTAQLKHQFLANMSHEIRTPMNAIVGMTRLLLNKKPPPDQLRYLNAIQLSANNLLVIINDILDLSKIEAGKIIIEQTDFNLNEVLQSVQEMLLLKAEEKGIQIKLSTDSGLPNRLKGDPTRINQILVNLAGNAVKFTERGYVEIKTSLISKSDKLWIKFDVIDTGIGIAPEFLDNIFDSFTQAGSDVTRKFGGTGLGLTISRQLVTLMHGDISVKSELGKGTTFTVDVPLELARTPESAEPVNILNDASLQRLSNLSILLVEDNEFNQMVAEETLKEVIPGLQLDIAENGQEALKKLQQEHYDIVLMDIQMPVMDGVTATRTIRTTLPEPLRSIKIIAMTANVLSEDVRQYLDAGMDAYVSKPFQINDLLLKMDGLLVGHKKKDRKVPAQVKTQPIAVPAEAQPKKETPQTAVQQPAVEQQQKEQSTNYQEVTDPPPTYRKPGQIQDTRRSNPNAPKPVQPPAAPQNTSVPAAPVPQPVVPARAELPEFVTDRNFLKQFTGGNPEKMQKYITMFMENATRLLATIDQALVNKDYATIKIAAHSLKPQLSYMGVKEEVSHIFLIEQSAGSSAHFDALPDRIKILKKVCEKAFEELRAYS